MNASTITKYYQDLHAKECKKTGEKIPQTLLGKKLRYILKMIESIDLISKS